ncbi:PREDICTED: uncharacterized protein LOC109485600 [Branchiostoma belcheri]|uniref:Uncharacterized protein LOC109485600 n=1 Tax=Branchiostoma belcheri TaxID=7741 RepID=A0A6P4ZUK6_BRABE|nr:PREDICTED: uncharacterized protein LOC109485600 [Branchiostoma belcheri]XP_019644855.1 PREDICTED: uncharacterized protein LOC109485600 [Branchiostoma belcheri]
MNQRGGGEETTDFTGPDFSLSIDGEGDLCTENGCVSGQEIQHSLKRKNSKQVTPDTSKGPEEEVTKKRHRNTSSPAADQPHGHSGSSKSSSEDMDSMKALNKELGQEMKMMFMNWAVAFSESEQFELFCPTRVDSLLQEARALEENLKEQKKCLLQRLQMLSQTLQQEN